jgi:hypothetical protein
MEEEATSSGDDEAQEKDSPPSKRKRIEDIDLDEEEAEIANRLRRVHETSQVASQLEQDKTISGGDLGAMGEGDDEGSEDGAVDRCSGDGYTGFENNGVCP